MTPNLLRFGIAMCLLFSTSLPVLAQESTSEKTEKKAPFYVYYVKDLSHELSLSTDQSEKITAILKDSHEKMMALCKDKKEIPFKEKRTRLKPIKDQTEAQVLALLSPEQKNLYATYKTEKKKHLKATMQEHFLKRLDKKLTLSEDQKIQIKALIAKQADRKQFRESIEALLTPEQKEVFRSHDRR